MYQVLPRSLTPTMPPLIRVAALTFHNIGLESENKSYYNYESISIDFI